MTKPYVRKVTGAEKYFIAYNELRPPFIIQLVVEGDGDPAPEDLYAALEKCTAANPGSSLRLRDEEEPLEWVIGPPPTLTVVDAPNFCAQDQDNAPFLTWTLNATTGPTCELVYVRGKAKNYLIFRAAHSVMDGRGTLAWAKDFMACLRGEAPVGHPSDLSSDELLKEIKIDSRPLPAPDALHPFGVADVTAHGQFRWRRIQIAGALDPTAPGRIIVNLARQARLHGEGPFRVNLPSDIRHYHPEKKTTANFFNAFFINVPPEATGQGIGLKIVQLLYKHEGKKTIGVYGEPEAGSLSLHRAKAFWDLGNVHETRFYPVSATLSHLGVIKGEQLSGGDFVATGALFVPMVGDSGCVVTINGFDDHVETTIGLSVHFCLKGEMDVFDDLVRRAFAGEEIDHSAS